MKISEMITDRYKLRIPPTIYEELMEYFQTFQHCDKCGYVHHWTLTLSENFKKAVIDMLIRGEV